MKHVKTFEGFLDIFKKNELNKEFSSILDRLKKVQKLRQNPYTIRKYNSGRDHESPIDWIDFTAESMYQGRLYCGEYYEVLFDDVTIVSIKYESEKFFPMYALFIREADSDITGIEETRELSKSIKKDIWISLADIYKKQGQYKEFNRIKSIINKSADLL